MQQLKQFNHGVRMKKDQAKAERRTSAMKSASYWHFLRLRARLILV